MSICRFGIFFALLTTCGLLFAADDKGKFMSGSGVGAVECPQFVRILGAARRFGVGSPKYANEMQGFDMYVSGYRAAYNEQTPKTCDIFWSISSDQIFGWIENYCKARPLEKVGSAVIALSGEMYPKRLQACQ